MFIVLAKDIQTSKTTYYDEQASAASKKLGTITGIVSSDSWFGNESFKMMSALINETGKALYVA